MDNMCAVEVMARLKEKHEIEAAKMPFALAVASGRGIGKSALMMILADDAYSPIIDRIIDINEGKKEIK